MTSQDRGVKMLGLIAVFIGLPLLLTGISLFVGGTSEVVLGVDDDPRDEVHDVAWTIDAQ